MKLCFIFGTRPEIIKLSPLIRECRHRDIPFFVIHSNQHFSANMDTVFFEELKLPHPKYNLGISNHSLHGKMTGMMIDKIEDILLKEKPDYVIIQGDTNTVLAGALAASKLNTPVAHIEAGLRSYDRTMPEEINRVVADHVSNILFAPTNRQKVILKGEGIATSKIFVVGNTIVDAVKQNLKIAETKDIHLLLHSYILLTMHRPSNVDNRVDLKRQLDNLSYLVKKVKIPIIFPIHPRTRKQLKKFKIKIDENLIKVIDPVGFLEMLILEKHARLIITDSGGLQEEACILKVPCVTLRDNTERPETIDVKSNVLVGSNRKKLINSVLTMLKGKKNWRNPFGTGNSSEKIITRIIVNTLKK